MTRPTTDIDAILRQREELKRGFPDAILLFQAMSGIGGHQEDGYKAFKEDALLLDDAIRGGGIEGVHFDMEKSGYNLWFPANQLERVLDRIVKAGRRAAVCELAKVDPTYADNWTLTPVAAGERVAAEGTNRFSSGEWWMAEDGRTIYAGYAAPGDSGFPWPGKHFVCEVGDTTEGLEGDDPVADANAKLIISAPHMLAALKRFVAWDRGPHPTDSGLDPVREAVNDAIARAEGRNS